MYALQEWLPSFRHSKEGTCCRTRRCFEHVSPSAVLQKWVALYYAQEAGSKLAFLDSEMVTMLDTDARPPCWSPVLEGNPICKVFWKRMMFQRNDVEPLIRAVTSKDVCLGDVGPDSDDEETSTEDTIYSGHGIVKR